MRQPPSRGVRPFGSVARLRSRDIGHIGSVHDETQLAVLKAVARQRLAAGQGEMDLELDDSPDAAVFRQLVLARIIEPTSKQDSLRVLQEAGIDAVSYPTINRRRPVYAQKLVDFDVSECLRVVSHGVSLPAAETP
jgi:hypothetical protein